MYDPDLPAALRRAPRSEHLTPHRLGSLLCVCDLDRMNSVNAKTESGAGRPT